LRFESSVGCSTNRALGYAIGRQFKDSIVQRLKILGGQKGKALVSFEIICPTEPLLPYACWFPYMNEYATERSKFGI